MNKFCFLTNSIPKSRNLSQQIEYSINKYLSLDYNSIFAGTSHLIFGGAVRDQER